MKALQRYSPLFIVIIGIVLMWLHRISSLENPYFWDEMGVYGNGVQYLLENGISIMPNAMPTEISRGHPLLFYAIHAFVLKVFGNTFVVSHFFALLLSSACLVSTYFLAIEVVSKLMAAMAVLLLASANIFLAQSTFILPEMTVALLSNLALLSYFKRSYILMAIFLAIGVLVKESMIVSAGFLGLLYLVELLKDKTFKAHIGQLFIFTIPLGVFLSFLVVQKIQNGWYFFPYHTDIVKEGALSGFFEKLEMHYNFIFFKQGRNQWLILILLTAASLLFSATKRKTLILGSYLLFSILVFSFAFYMDRYLLFLYPILVIVVVKGASFISLQNKIVSTGILFILVLLSILEHQDSTFRYDASLAYQDLIMVHQEAINLLCNEEKTVLNCQANFPINMSLESPRLGYANAACQSKIHLVDTITEAEYIILYHADFMDDAFALLAHFKQNEAEVAIYKR